MCEHIIDCTIDFLTYVAPFIYVKYKLLCVRTFVIGVKWSFVLGRKEWGHNLCSPPEQFSIEIDGKFFMIAESSIKTHLKPSRDWYKASPVIPAPNFLFTITTNVPRCRKLKSNLNECDRSLSHPRQNCEKNGNKTVFWLIFLTQLCSFNSNS